MAWCSKTTLKAKKWSAHCAYISFCPPTSGHRPFISLASPRMRGISFCLQPTGINFFDLQFYQSGYFQTKLSQKIKL